MAWSESIPESKIIRMSQNLGVPIIVTNDKKQILIGRRNQTKLYAGMYQTPAGGVEPGEPLFQTAIRELKEETNLDATKIEFIGVVREWQTDHEYVHFGHLITEYAGELQNTEPEKNDFWKWYDIDKLPSPIVPGHHAIIDLYKSQQQLIDIPQT